MTPRGGYDRETIYRLERESLREFVAGAVPWSGRVLDYGCGKQPYRDLVEKTAGEYVGFDRATFPANVSGYDFGGDEPLAYHPEGGWDAILCTQVVQYVPNVYLLLRGFRDALRSGGALVLTGPGCWAEVQPEDLHRFTKAGISRLLRNAGFTVERIEDRATLDLGGFRLSLGWGAVGRA